MNDINRPALSRLAALAGLAAALTVTGCKSNNAQAAGVNGQDPADANLAQPYTGGNTGNANSQVQVLGQSESYTPQASGQSYETQAPAPIIRQAPAGTPTSTEYYPVPQAQPAQYADQSGYNYTDAEEAGEQAMIEADQAPPPLPEYDQPPAPADNYIWTPGYWDYASTGYYWVPGAWVAPPFYGALWTPPYWGYYNNHYMFHRGYWGPHVGYYGGINYGFGYIGFGYFGGYWRDHNFVYNRAVTNVNVNVVHNYYQRTVVYNNVTYGPHPTNRIDYTGGRGGLNIQPRPQELAAMREAHYAPVPAQRENRVAAASNRGQFFAATGGRPAQVFTPHPIGNAAAIPATPREQAFNHPGANPGLNTNRPGAPNQPGFASRPGEPNNAARPGEFNRPGAPNQPGFAGRPGEPNNAARPGEFNRPGAPNQPGFAGRPGERNNNRPGEPNLPNGVHQPTATPGANHPYTTNRPNVEGERPNMVPNRGFGVNQPNGQSNPNINRPAQPNPNFERNQPNANRPALDNRAPQSQMMQRPNIETRPAQPQPAARPNFEPQRPAPEVQRSAPAAPAPHAAPAPAQHAAPAAPPHGGGGAQHGGGGEHGHPH